MEKRDHLQTGIERVRLDERITVRLSDVDVKRIAEFRLKTRASVSDVIRMPIRNCPSLLVEQAHKEKQTEHNADC